jgi:glutaredoxin
MKALIWSRDACIYCENAKALLEREGIKYEERKIGVGWTKEQLLESVPTAKTLPQIYLDGKYIGGFTELRKYFEKHGE